MCEGGGGSGLSDLGLIVGAPNPALPYSSTRLARHLVTPKPNRHNKSQNGGSPVTLHDVSRQFPVRGLIPQAHCRLVVSALFVRAHTNDIYYDIIYIYDGRINAAGLTGRPAARALSVLA